MNTAKGRIFTVSRTPSGMTTETCRDCGWFFTYRERATPAQRTNKSTHVCHTQLVEWEIALTRQKETTP